MTKSANCTFCIPKLLSPSHRWQYPSIETRASLNFETDRWRRALPCTLKQCIRDQGIRVYSTCHWSISLLDRESDPRTLGSFASYSDTLRSLYSDAAVAAPGTACTRHQALPLLWLSRPLYFWRLGLPFERDVPRLFLVVLFSLVQVYWCKCSSTWKGRIWANEGGSQSPDRGFSWYSYYSLLARTFAAAVGASLHWLTAVCQRKCPNLGVANVRYTMVANVRSIMVANVRLENVSQSKQTAIEKTGLSHEVWPHRGSNSFQPYSTQHF